MKIQILSLLVCAIMALTRALPEAENEHWTEETTPPERFTTTEGGWHPYCPDGWTMYNTHCVLYVPRYMTWTEAEDNCRSRGGNLASVLDAEQAANIHKEMQKAGDNHEHLWVGGYNTPENPSWSWSDNLFDIFHGWCRGENAEHKHHCLQITFIENMSGCLDDMQCDTSLPSVCGIIIM